MENHQQKPELTQQQIADNAQSAITSVVSSLSSDSTAQDRREATRQVKEIVDNARLASELT